MCVCVCVCVCIYIYIYIFSHRVMRKREMVDLVNLTKMFYYKN